MPPASQSRSADAGAAARRCASRSSATGSRAAARRGIQVEEVDVIADNGLSNPDGYRLNSTAVRALPSVLLPGISPLRSAVAGLRATPLPCQRLHDELHLPVSLVALSAASDWDFRRRQVTDLLLFLMAVNNPLDWIKKWYDVSSTS
ncbi:hypothetical protein EJB05_12727 [Eragrostis curvula]|uniref:Uncharacterized protein n=1 Tax=Eragrostis curvula TaxID=38414 RepID=A0A5J9VV78_9POAL|nr:hypothetical protein EJB05_12727 [Eragrostis curvula]